MEFKILIPSYHRHVRQDTLELLSSYVFKKSDIVISTQEPSDFEKYSEKYGERATVIYKKGNSVGDNRNTLLEWCQQNRVKRAIMLDDDIRGFRTYNGKKLVRADVSVNIYAHLKAVGTNKPVEITCAIGDTEVDGHPYSEIVDIARQYIREIGGFERFAEWGLID